MVRSTKQVYSSGLRSELQNLHLVILILILFEGTRGRVMTDQLTCTGASRDNYKKNGDQLNSFVDLVSLAGAVFSKADTSDIARRSTGLIIEYLTSSSLRILIEDSGSSY